jgi:hypothetical protein
VNALHAVKRCPLWVFVRQHGWRDVSGLYILRAVGITFSAWPGGDVRWSRPGDGESRLVLEPEGWLGILERDARIQLVPCLADDPRALVKSRPS